MKRMLLLTLLCAILQGCLASEPPSQPPSQPSTEQKSSEQKPSEQKTGEAKNAARTIICIDPGHPSETSAGSEVQNGTTEVHIAWAVALKLQALLEAEGIGVTMTKSKETEKVTNKERAMIANRANAAVMLRLHCDASTDSGYAVYAPDRQGTVQGVTGPAQTVIDSSQAAAEVIHRGMKGVLDGILKDGGVRGDSKTLIGSKQGALTGSIFSAVPAVLVEMVVLSNKGDADFIKTADGQMKMAQALAEGIKLYLKKI